MGRDAGDATYGRFAWKAPAEGLVQVGGPHSMETEWTDEFEIAYTKVGSEGPLVLFLHGVPTNRMALPPLRNPIERARTPPLLSHMVTESNCKASHGRSRQLREGHGRCAAC